MPIYHVLYSSARRDVPEDGEKHRGVDGVLERGDDGTRRHGSKCERGEWTDWAVGYFSRRLFFFFTFTGKIAPLHLGTSVNDF
jgi:hypothetical protein